MKESVRETLGGLWFVPRPTFRKLLDQPDPPWLPLLAACWGVERNLSAQLKAAIPDVGWIDVLLLVVGNVVSGALLGWSMWYFTAWVTARLASLLGHPTEARSVRLAMAWGTVPKAAAVVVLLAFIALVGPDFFMLDQRGLMTAHLWSLPAVFLPWLLSSLLYMYWVTVGVSEVSGMSILKTIPVLVLSAVPIVAVVAAIAVGMATLQA